MGAAKKLMARIIRDPRVDTLGRSMKKSRAAKGISGKMILRLWNKGHRYIWIAEHCDVTVQTVSYHLQKAIAAGEDVRRKKYKYSKMLSKVVEGKADELFDDRGPRQNLSIPQIKLLKLLVRQKEHQVRHEDIAPFTYWTTLGSLVARKMLKISGKWIILTPKGQIASHQEPPLEVILKE